VKEAFLGAKSHDPKDPSSQLAGMFRQVVGTMFSCVEKFEPIWKDIQGVSETEKYGEENYGSVPEPIEVSFLNTVKAFKSNYNNYIPFYRELLSKEIQAKYLQLQTLETSNVDFSSEIWAKTVYAFMARFRREKSDSRDALLLLDALRVLWIGRVAAFMKDTWGDERDQAEEKVREEARVFAKLKSQLVEIY
jgi:hypothetical protein